MQQVIKAIGELTPEQRPEALNALIESVKALKSLTEQGKHLQYIRRLLKVHNMPDLVSMAKDKRATRAFNTLGGSQLQQKEALHIPERFKELETIKRRLRNRCPKNKEYFMYDVMAIGALRPADLMNMEAYKQGNAYYTNTQAKGRGSEVLFVAPIPVPLLMRYIKRCRSWIAAGQVDAPTTGKAKQILKTTLGINFKDLRTIGAYLYASTARTTKDRIYRSALMVRHQPGQYPPILHYMHVYDD